MIFIDLFSPSFISRQIGSAREPCPLGTHTGLRYLELGTPLPKDATAEWEAHTDELALATTAESPAEELSCCGHSVNMSLLAEPSHLPSVNISQRINDRLRERSCLIWVWRYVPRTLTLETQRQECCPKLEAILDSVARRCLKKVTKRKWALD